MLDTPPPALDLDAHCHDCGLELAREGGCPDHPALTKPRTDDGGEILDPAILERQAARRAGIAPAQAALGVYRCRIPHLGKLGRALDVYSRGEVVAVKVNLDGEGDRVDVWSPSLVERVEAV